MTDSSCPYKNIMNNFSFFGGGAKKTEDSSTNKCPYSEQVPKKDAENIENKVEEDKKEENSSDDDKPKGGCPVLNKSIQKI